MFVVIVGSVTDTVFFFGPFDNKVDADSWAREYSIQHGKTVEVALLHKQFDQLAGNEYVKKQDVIRCDICEEIIKYNQCQCTRDQHVIDNQ